MAIIGMFTIGFAALLIFSKIAERLNRSIMIDEMLARLDENLAKQEDVNATI